MNPPNASVQCRSGIRESANTDVPFKGESAARDLADMVSGLTTTNPLKGSGHITPRQRNFGILPCENLGKCHTGKYAIHATNP